MEAEYFVLKNKIFTICKSYLEIEILSYKSTVIDMLAYNKKAISMMSFGDIAFRLTPGGRNLAVQSNPKNYKVLSGPFTPVELTVSSVHE